MSTPKFPQDFNKSAHPLSAMEGGIQFKPKEKQPIFISIVGGALGLYGDGVTHFEMMLGDKVYPYQTEKEINTILRKVYKLISY